MNPIKTIFTAILLLSFSYLYAQNGDVNSGKLKNILSGIASYYHDKFHGRQMANGEIYSKDGFTAASNSFPLNRWVRVVNLINGESVIVKITDRMAKNNKRLIDLSRISATRLKMIGRGLVKVEVELLTDYSPETSETAKLEN